MVFKLGNWERDTQIPSQTGFRIMILLAVTCCFVSISMGEEWGPWLVLVSPCFRETVVVTCKIGSFLCNLDNLLQKNLIVFCFGNQISKWRSFEKRAIFDLLFTCFSHQGKLQKFLQHMSHSHTCIYFAQPIRLFLPYQFWKKKKKLSGMVSLWCDFWCWFLFVSFWNNQLIIKWWSKLKLECLLLICIYTNAKFIVICKPWTFNDGRWRLSSIQKTQKALLLSSSHFAFYQ